MAYKTDTITQAQVIRLLEIAGAQPGFRGLKQPEMLDLLRGELEYYDADLVVDGVVVVAAGDVIPRPHEDLEARLRSLKLQGKAHFVKPDGWRLR